MQNQYTTGVAGLNLKEVRQLEIVSLQLQVKISVEMVWFWCRFYP
jgi:hypothetical protein